MAVQHENAAARDGRHRGGSGPGMIGGSLRADRGFVMAVRFGKLSGDGPDSWRPKLEVDVPYIPT
jgi:hypothetical protein